MPDSTLNRRSVALYVAEPTQFSYPQETAECQIFQRVRSSWPISIGVLPQAVALPEKHRRLGALGLRRAKFASVLARGRVSY